MANTLSPLAYGVNFGVRIVLVVALLVALLSGCRRQSDNRDPVLLQVADQTLTLGAFQSAFAESLEPEQILSDEVRYELQRDFLLQLIDQTLLATEADALGITVTAAELEAALDEIRRDYPEGEMERILHQQGRDLNRWRDELAALLRRDKLVQQAVESRIHIDEADLSAYYQANRERYERPAQVRARQILLASKEQGNQVLELLRQGQPFAEVARRYSLTPDSKQGGDLGYFGPGKMPAEFDAVVFSLPVGELSPLVPSDYGFHLFLVEERREAVFFSLEDARDDIIKQLRHARWEQAYLDWLQDLRNRADIDIDWALLEPQVAPQPSTRQERDL